MALRQHVEQTGKRDGFEGPGELATMLTVWQRTEELQAQIEEVGIEREQGVRG